MQIAAINDNVQLAPTAEFDEHGTPHEPTSKDPVDGWFIDLDRGRINRLIRLLQKARDKAYGADA